MELSSVRVDEQDVNPGPGFNGGAVANDQAVSMEAGIQSISPDPYASTTPDQHSWSVYSSGTESPLSTASPADHPSRLESGSGMAVSIVMSSEGQRAKALKSLKESIPHRMHLELLQKSERQYQKDGSYHKKNVRRLSKELYVVVSWYALLQSALFAAVAQTTIFTCEDWWGPVFIAVLVTVGTFASAVDKLWNMGKQQQEVLLFLARQNAIYDNIAKLHWLGSACPLDSLHAEHEVVRRVFSRVFSPHSFLVLGFLVGFSTLVIVSCLKMLCGPSCKC